MLSGVVVDTAGNAVPGAQLLVSRWQPNREFSFVSSKNDEVLSVVAETDGTFRVNVETLGYLVSLGVTAKGFAPAFVDAASPSAGTTRVVLSLGVNLHGAVSAEDGKRIAGATLRFVTEIGRGFFEVTTVSDSNGEYRLVDLPYQPSRVSHDRVTLIASKPSYASEHVSIRMAQAVGDTRESQPRVWQLDVALSVGSTLAGKVFGPGTMPVGGANIIVWGSYEPFGSWTDIDLTRDSPNQWIVANCQSTADGAFQLEHMPLAPPQTRFGPAHFIDRIVSGAQPRFRGGLLIMAAGFDPLFLPCPLASRVGAVLEQPIELSPAATVLGKVIDSTGLPVAGVKVECRIAMPTMISTLRIGSDPAQQVSFSLTNSDGEFRFEGIPSHGKYDRRVLITAQSDHDLFSTTELVVSAGQIVQLEKPLCLGGEPWVRHFRGILRNDEGQRIVGAAVGWTDQKHYALWSAPGYYDTTDADGSFALYNFSGTYRLYVYAPGYEILVMDWHDRVWHGELVELRLDAETLRTGVVVDERDQPIVGCELSLTDAPVVYRLNYPHGTDSAGQFVCHGLGPRTSTASFDLPLSQGMRLLGMNGARIWGQTADQLVELTANQRYVFPRRVAADDRTLTIELIDAKTKRPIVQAIQANFFPTTLGLLAAIFGTRSGDTRSPDDTLIACEVVGQSLLRGWGVPQGTGQVWIEAAGYRSERKRLYLDKDPPHARYSIPLTEGLVATGKIEIKGARPGLGTLFVRCELDDIPTTEFIVSPEADGRFQIPLTEAEWILSAVVETSDGEFLMASHLHAVRLGGPSQAAPTLPLQLELLPTELVLLMVPDVDSDVQIRDSEGNIWFQRACYQANRYQARAFDRGFRVWLPRGDYEALIVEDNHGKYRKPRVVHTQRFSAPSETEIKFAQIPNLGSPFESVPSTAPRVSARQKRATSTVPAITELPREMRRGNIAGGTISLESFAAFMELLCDAKVIVDSECVSELTNVGEVNDVDCDKLKVLLSSYGLTTQASVDAGGAVVLRICPQR
ncbi:MAG: hypothetical protein ACKVX7_18330 [Planctomycetota bacterium]